MFLGLVLISCSYIFQPKDNEKCSDEFGEFCSIIFPIFESKCLGCHSGEDPSGAIDLTSFNSIVNSGIIDDINLSNSILYRSIVDDDSPMPPEGEIPLTDDEIQTITNWILEGAIQF